jgi:CRISPR-associated protein Cas1
MQDIKGQDLKTILHSKRANIYYLEHCRVLVNGGRVEYVTDAGKRSLYWNIPIANTTSILLGTGTSITQAAMRELAKAGVLVGFCGGGGTPLFSANEVDVEVAWLTPQSEYRPTEYLQAWVRFWFDEELRLHAARQLQACRLQRLQQEWGARALREAGFAVDMERLKALVQQFTVLLANAPDVMTLLTDEARLTKALFKLAVDAVGYGEFTRAKRGTGTDAANRYLDHGMRGDDEPQFRRQCIEALTRSESLDFIIDTLKRIAIDTARMAGAPATPAMPAAAQEAGT